MTSFVAPLMNLAIPPRLRQAAIDLSSQLSFGINSSDVIRLFLNTISSPVSDLTLRLTFPPLACSVYRCLNYSFKKV